MFEKVVQLMMKVTKNISSAITFSQLSSLEKASKSTPSTKKAIKFDKLKKVVK